MPKISVCIISFNEEDRIEDCLKSVASVADEIVVVDSGSSDRTREIAARYAYTLIEQPFLGYVEQKNFAVDHAANDWILSLDCDERVTPELARSILAVKDRLADCSAWSFNRKNYYLYRWLDHAWYPELRVRLFDRRVCRWGGGKLHEHVVVSSGTTGHLQGDLHHYSYHSLSDHLAKLNTFTDIAAAELLKQGRTIFPGTVVIHSFWGFFRSYFVKRACLDGFAGLTVAVSTALYEFCKYGKAYLARIAPKP
jgi:glycosyltransferase involved in cell wall biosynthesis